MKLLSNNWLALSAYTLTIFISFVAHSQEAPCDYFGLERPDTIPRDFDPEVLSLDGAFIFNGVFSVPNCDEFYFTKIDAKENIYFSKKVNGVWQSPLLASFSHQSYHDADPFFTQDGKRIYFVSSRPIDVSDTKFDYNIWYAERNDKGWDTPVVLPAPINTDDEEYFFSISNKGNAFFASNRPGGIGSFDIYQLQILEDGSMSDPVNLGGPINTNKYEFDPHISLDERFMIFSINNADGFSDLYFSYKNEQGEWAETINMGDQINTPVQDFAPSLTPDNRYLIYTYGGDLKWIHLDVLEKLKSR